jgi:hypothetical protein
MAGYNINQRLVSQDAQTSAQLTDNSGGTASTTIADITEVNNAGSADRVPVENAIASLAAQVNALQTEVAGLLADS